jgi:hypothetical protein
MMRLRVIREYAVGRPDAVSFTLLRLEPEDSLGCEAAGNL